MDLRASTVNLNVIPNLISEEDICVLSADTFSHNDLRSDDSEEQDEILENDDGDEHQYEIGQQSQFHGYMGAGPTTFSQFQSSMDVRPSAYSQFHDSMGAGTSAHHMEPPALEFIDVSWANQAMDRQWVQQQVQLQNTNENLYVGAQFAMKAELIYAAKMYHIEAHAQYKVTHSDPGCNWKLTASIPDGHDFFRIARLQPVHTCSNPIINQDHAQLDSGFVADYIKETVKSDLSITIGAIIAVIKTRFNFTISYKKAWLAKQMAIAQLFGDWDESYKVLPEFMDALQRSNPRTVVVPNCEQTNRPNVQMFKRVFWAFGPTIEGFRHCHPVICVDATHLYGKYQGKLLIVVGFDRNGQLFPLAFAVTEGESNSSWSWFMACLRDKVIDRPGLCVISDRHIGIINAMKDPHLDWQEPLAYHRFCIRHLASNFNTVFKNKELKNVVHRMSLLTQQVQFEKLWAEIDTIDDGAVTRWLRKIPLASWTLLYDEGKRWGHMTTNMVETFNGVLKAARALPITTLVQLTFYRCNAYYTLHRQDGQARAFSGTEFTPEIDLKLQGLRQQSNAYEVEMFHHQPGVFEVKHASSRLSHPSKPRLSNVVDLGNATCTCNEWLIYPYTCSHVIAACSTQRINRSQFVDGFYSMQSYLNTWAPMFFPVSDRSTWPTYYGPVIVPDPSLRRSKKGRPQSTRLHNEMDARDGARRPHRCGLCHTVGHTKRSCPNRN